MAIGTWFGEVVAEPEEDEFFPRNFLLILTALNFLGWGATKGELELVGAMDEREGREGFVGEIKWGGLEIHGVSEGAAGWSSETVDASPPVFNTHTSSSPP